MTILDVGTTSRIIGRWILRPFTELSKTDHRRISNAVPWIGMAQSSLGTHKSKCTPQSGGKIGPGLAGVAVNGISELRSLCTIS